MDKTKNISEIEQFKLMAISTKEFSDADVERSFLELPITSDVDFHEIVGVLHMHRPAIHAKLSASFHEKTAL